jgi:hypothetical protein
MNTQELPVSIETHIKIVDLDSNEILVEGSNAIHKEHMSLLLANSLSHGITGYISEMHFGCGGIVAIATDGSITYRKPNIVGANADLHTPTYFKVVDTNDFNNSSNTTNNVTVSHLVGIDYADVVITATLDYEEPLAVDSTYNLFDSTSDRIDPTTIFNGEFEFNEIGLKTKGTSGLNSGVLLTHFIFHPVQKNIEQRIQIIYTLRVRAG